ncbi:MAG: Vms1/Ankzf1 family peptidyl-tRNA hydrolase [Nitrosopumilus sp.]|nr:Vms1/Ankzf1 family peptidyl-tRNA hydrolase [Nitrosopumilus sp.]MDH3736268.1 Vms1/Ankzf1 family peptidyl-tRNA hydrolase [Nitrosopumilus sp.]MDH3822350.1 Vms1/Ankzf1 family peptidyl-tRNA hydrolase [Nitrosopumilus sp.]MDH3833576.1 Vms1/Ankzf1 family peptidyl-tRNA hydrolase [Nitrosopumilus sp.]
MALKKFNSSEINPSEWYSINRFTLELESQKSACVSVYYPHDKNLETVYLLRETKRDEATEKIESAIEKRIAKLSKATNPKKQFINTYCIFGWQSNRKVILKDIAISKKLPYVYLVGKKPYLKPFYDILKANYHTILVILDHKSAHIRYLQGDKILAEERLSINLQGRHKKGGQSQKRFLRARHTFIQGFFKKIAKKVSNLDSNDVEILFLGGVGIAKTEFHDELNSELKKKCRFIDDISFDTATNDVNRKIIKNLYDHRKKYVLEIIAKFEKLVKENLVTEKNSEIQKALEVGAVDTLLVSANYYHASPMSKKITKMIEMAENTSSKIEFITNPKLVEKLAKYDHVLALLRYKFK